MRNFFLFVLFALPAFLSAQSWEFGLAVNAANYQGDVVKTDLFTLKETNPAFGLFLRRNFNDYFALRLNGNYMRLSGNDANFSDREIRGYTFKNTVLEGSLQLEVTTMSAINKAGKPRAIRPYFFAGIGYASGDPTVFFNETVNTAYAAAIQKDKANVEKEVVVFPLGAGFKFALSEKVGLGAEIGFRPTLGDYTDGVSEAGNPEKEDWYVLGGLNLAFKIGKPKDTDADGIGDKKDKCPDVPGVAENMGCPADRDKDGVYDTADNCPDVMGVIANMGCPADRDKDGVYDRDDKCPDVAGVATNLGCPSDLDKDGVVDADDRCPELPGIAANKGCPADRDADGVYDVDDRCPDLAGVTANKGCPADQDNDGVYDKDDKCPTLAGLPANAGCPNDRDKDGVYDNDDRCPDLFGIAANRGCPAMKAEEAKVMNVSVKNITFKTNSAVLTPGSYKILDQVATILKKYLYFSVALDGHTDNVGNEAANLTLSRSRAKTCYDYLIKKGVVASRLAYEGYGETKPIDTNETKAGKQQNRRVEFNLSVK